MAFPVDERVSCVVMRNNPLVNRESHFTASFGSSWVVHGLQIVIIIFTVQTVAMACTKQTKRRDESKQLKLARQPSKWGTAASGVTHRPSVLPARTDNTSGNPSYNGIY